MMQSMTALALLTGIAFAGGNPDAFRIEVVDQDTGRGVPLVELRTTHNVRYYTDSNGLVAFSEPGLMDQRVFFHVASHGYEFEKDGFGYAGVRLDVTPGGRATLRLQRINIAERLYRMTGGGGYRDTVLLGEPAPIREPLLNDQVLGCDSVQTAVYRDRLYWFFGDTARPSYPLGNFFMSGATSLLPEKGGLDPAVGVDLTFFVDDEGFAKKMAPMPGAGPCWADAFVTLKDAGGRERLFAAYARVRADMSARERGFIEYDDRQEQFVQRKTFDLDAPVFPSGHPFRHTVDGVEYLYFDVAFPLVRVRADPDSLLDLGRYEAFTPLVEGSRLDAPQVERDGEGRVRFGWTRNTPPLRPKDHARLVQAGLLKPDEALIRLQDTDSGEPVIPHNGSVAWNDFRRRWITLRCQSFGTTMLGETWYAEADTPLGPWVYARKVVTHDHYSFYNPKQHPEFDQQGGRVIYFEGTYANTFSGNPVKTPWYDYNQIMYRLDLGDDRLVLPVPVYAVSDDPPTAWATWHRLPDHEKARPIAFFAYDRSREGAVAIFEEVEEGSGRRLRPASANQQGVPVFHALPADLKTAPTTTVPLYEFTRLDRPGRTYAAGEDVEIAGYRRADRPLCRVFRSPLTLPFPADRQ